MTAAARRLFPGEPTGSDRYPVVISAEEALRASVIHAKARFEDTLTFCEQGGGRRLPEGSVVLCLDSAVAHKHVHAVSCQDCLEWMHA